MINTQKSDCIYHAPIDLEPNGRPFGPNKSVHGKYNLISVRFIKISKIILCVYGEWPESLSWVSINFDRMKLSASSIFQEWLAWFPQGCAEGEIEKSVGMFYMLAYYGYILKLSVGIFVGALHIYQLKAFKYASIHKMC